ncbi:hypothetical protein EON65_54085 [archaeon]|nr:MAG: hypothetical protein EON65_54085 [archaeon]
MALRGDVESATELAQTAEARHRLYSPLDCPQGAARLKAAYDQEAVVHTRENGWRFWTVQQRNPNPNVSLSTFVVYMCVL